MTSGHIVLHDIRKRYGVFQALDGVSMDIRPGEFLTFLGPSGSGKTTLLNVLAGFVRPDSGSMTVDGVEFLTRPPHRRSIGMVFQSYALFPHMTVAGNVDYPLRLRRVARDERRRRVADALATVQMDHLGSRNIRELSGGQRQRVALARAIVSEPAILLMDEPLSALDKNLREHMQIELRRLHKRLGMTTVYVTHDQREALTMSDRIAVINRGNVVQLDRPEVIYERPADAFSAQFMGETSLVPLETAGGRLCLFGRPVRISPEQTGERTAGLLVVRPERLRWDGDEARDNRLDGTVLDVAYQGESSLVSLLLQNESTIAIRRAAADDRPLPSVGARVSVWLPADATVVVDDAS